MPIGSGEGHRLETIAVGGGAGQAGRRPDPQSAGMVAQQRPDIVVRRTVAQMGQHLGLACGAVEHEQAVLGADP